MQATTEAGVDDPGNVIWMTQGRFGIRTTLDFVLYYVSINIDSITNMASPQHSFVLLPKGKGQNGLETAQLGFQDT